MVEEKLAISFRKGLPLSKEKYPGYNPRTVEEAGIKCELFDFTDYNRGVIG